MASAKSRRDGIYHVLGRMRVRKTARHLRKRAKESVKAVEMILEDEIDQAMNDLARKRESQS